MLNIDINIRQIIYDKENSLYEMYQTFQEQVSLMLPIFRGFILSIYPWLTSFEKDETYALR